jgi:hypothetical protein
MLAVARCTHRAARGAWMARAASSTSVPDNVSKQPKPVPGQLKDDQLQYDSVTHTGQVSTAVCPLGRTVPGLGQRRRATGQIYLFQ